MGAGEQHVEARQMKIRWAVVALAGVAVVGLVLVLGWSDDNAAREIGGSLLSGAVIGLVILVYEESAEDRRDRRDDARENRFEAAADDRAARSEEQMRAAAEREDFLIVWRRIDELVIEELAGDLVRLRTLLAEPRLSKLSLIEATADFLSSVETVTCSLIPRWLLRVGAPDDVTAANNAMADWMKRMQSTSQLLSDNSLDEAAQLISWLSTAVMNKRLSVRSGAYFETHEARRFVSVPPIRAGGGSKTSRSGPTA